MAYTIFLVLNQFRCSFSWTLLIFIWYLEILSWLLNFDFIDELLVNVITEILWSQVNSIIIEFTLSLWLKISIITSKSSMDAILMMTMVSKYFEKLNKISKYQHGCNSRITLPYIYNLTHWFTSSMTDWDQQTQLIL